MNEFRALRADEIEVRIGTVSEKGATLLLYQDGRCAMNILDETVGSWRWQRDHKEIKGNMYAGIGIYDPNTAQWVWKWDCGVESNTEKEKGEASDSFKRAAVNWGIGRELYTSPRIFINCDTEQKTGGGYRLANPYQFYGVSVSAIEYDAKGNISDLRLTNSYGKEIYTMGKKTSQTEEKRAISASQSAGIKDILAKTNSNTKEFLKNFGVTSVDDILASDYEKAQRLLKKIIAEWRNQ